MSTLDGRVVVQVDGDGEAWFTAPVLADTDYFRDQLFDHVKGAVRKGRVRLVNEINAAFPGAPWIGEADTAIRAAAYKGQGLNVTGTVSHRWGRGKGAGFIDYFSLHQTGETITPDSDGNFFIPFHRLSGHTPKKGKTAVIPMKDGGWLVVNRPSAKTAKMLQAIGVLVPQVDFDKRLDVAPAANETEAALVAALSRLVE